MLYSRPFKTKRNFSGRSLLEIQSPIIAQSGSTLIEVLISLLILSVSVLGFAGASLQGLNLTHLAHQQEEATRLVTEMSERMASNPKAINRYMQLLGVASSTNEKAVQASGASGHSCSDITKSSSILIGCSPDQRALNDVQALKRKASIRFPSGKFGMGACGESSQKQYCLVFAWYDTLVSQCLESHFSKRHSPQVQNSLWCIYLPAMSVI